MNYILAKKHLKSEHCLFEGSSHLNLKCSSCPCVFKTYSGFLKHCIKCDLKSICPSEATIAKEPCEIDDFSTNAPCGNSCEMEHDIEELDGEYDRKADSIDSDLNIFKLQLYSLGVPDTTVNIILEYRYELFFLFSLKI